MNEDIQIVIAAGVISDKKYCDYSKCVVQYIEHYHISEHTITFLKPDDTLKD